MLLDFIEQEHWNFSYSSVLDIYEIIAKLSSSVQVQNQSRWNETSPIRGYELIT